MKLKGCIKERERGLLLSLRYLFIIQMKYCLKQLHISFLYYNMRFY